MRVIARAPTRIDLAGGTLDIWPLYLLHRQSVTINLAVAIHATAEAIVRPSGFAIHSEDRGLSVEADDACDLAAKEPRLALAARLVSEIASEHPVTLMLRAAAPAHAGLGGSSALAIAATAALDRRSGGRRSHADILRLAMDIETAVIAVPTGQQDYLAAIGGGLQALHWEMGGVRSERLPDSALVDHLVLCYTGAPRFSGANNWDVTRARIDGNAAVTRHLDRIRDAARSLLDALRAGDLTGAAEAMNAEWAERRQLTPGITTEAIDALGRIAGDAGAVAYKVCGAGGGGCVVALAPGADARARVADAMRAQGGQVLDISLDERGLVVDET